MVAIGRLKERYPRVALARYYEIAYDERKAEFSCLEEEQRKQRAETLDGSYLLKSNRSDLSVEDIWRSRVETHIFLCVLAYHLLVCIERALLDQDIHTSWRPAFGLPQRIEELFQSHPDHDLFGSLPGAGPKIAPRLMAEIGDDRERFEDEVQNLQCLAGTAPVTKRSGKHWECHQRWACSKHLRYVLHLFSEHTISRCAWAEIYQAHRAKTNPTPQRSVASHIAG
jgi:hypothetical protein